MVTESRAHEQTQSSGASPTVWAIFFSSLAISIALVMEGSVRIEPNWTRWWAAILGLEISAYTLTLFLPPVARVNLLHALCRVGVGMLMRLFVVVLCAFLLAVGGEAGLVSALKLFWAAHWPSAIGQIVCVAIAVYCFRVIAMRRTTEARQPAGPSAPAQFVARSPEELLEELMADGASPESPGTAAAAVAPPVSPEAQPSAPFADQQTAEPPEAPPGIAPVAEAHAAPSQEAAAIEDRPEIAPQSLTPPPITPPAETDVQAPAPPEVAPEPTAAELTSDRSFDTEGLLPTALGQEPPTPPMADEAPFEGPPQAPVGTTEPPTTLQYPEPVPLPAMQPPSATGTGQPSAPPGLEAPSAPVPEEGAREGPMEPEEPTLIEGLPPTVPVADETAPEQVAAPEELAEVAQPSPLAEPEAQAAVHEPPAVAEEPLPEETPAEQAEAEIAVTDPSTSGALRLPAEVVLGALPADLLDRPIEEVAEKVPEGTFSFEWEVIAPQLERGQVRVSGQALLSQMPRDLLATSAGDFLSSLPTEGIELPLAEIVTRLPVDFFAAPPDQLEVEPLADEPPIFNEGPVRVPGEPASVAPSVPRPAPPPPTREPEAEQAGVEYPQPPPEPQPTAASAAPSAQQPAPPAPALVPEAEAQPAVESPPPGATVGEPPQEPDEAPADTDEEAAETPLAPPLTPPQAPLAASSPPDWSEAEVAVPAEAEPSPLLTPPPPTEERVLSTAIAALQRQEEAEEEEEAERETVEPATPPPTVPDQLGAPDRHEPADAEQESATPSEAAGPGGQGAAPEVAGGPDMPTAVPAEPAPEEETAPAEPPMVESPTATAELDPGLKAQLCAALEAVDCRGVELISTNGIAVLVAHSAPDTSTKLGASCADLVKTTHHLTARTGTGTFSSALVMGAHATMFVGSPGNPRAPHLVVATDSASAGQTTVAAKKAISLLESIETGQEAGAEEPSGVLPETLPSEDEGLRRVASVIRQEVGAFRGEDGFGVVALGLATEPSPEAAAAAEAVWRAAQAAQPSGVDRLLVIGSSRTLGLAMADKAGALVLAGFAPGMSPGLAATEATKLARMCNDLAQGEGIPTDGR